MIRKSQPRDYEQIAQMLRGIGHMHHEGRPDIFSDSSKYDAAGVQRLAQRPEMTIFVADNGDGIDGYIICKHRRYESDGVRIPYDCLWIDDLYVDSSKRNMGTGGELLDAAVALSRELGCKNTELNVWEFNTQAEKFYRGRGMTTQRRIMELDNSPCNPSED